MTNGSSSQLFHWIIDTHSRVSKSGYVDRKFDLIDFLAIAQAFSMRLLPITWESGRAQVGLGGTSKITQAMLNNEVSLAFKCLQDEDKIAENSTKNLYLLVNEIVTLKDPSFAGHPNIAQLHGICWDIASDDSVWPALVFEKSHLGDLSHFAAVTTWNDVNLSDRVRLCLEIGHALVDMHKNSKRFRYSCRIRTI
jgi:hypothetical protein